MNKEMDSNNNNAIDASTTSKKAVKYEQQHTTETTLLLAASNSMEEEEKHDDQRIVANDSDDDNNNKYASKTRFALRTCIGICLALFGAAVWAWKSGLFYRPLLLPPPPLANVTTSSSFDSSLSNKQQQQQQQNNGSSTKTTKTLFPSDFVWGVATSSYQIEGAIDEDGRGPTIWDAFCDEPKVHGSSSSSKSHILDHSSGAIACDHYHRMESDVELLHQLHIPAYRFSIAWSRILPTGTLDGGINQAGIDFYNRLINTLLAKNITPWVTLYHWDLPLSLEERYGGWLDHRTVEAFAQYARLVFTLYTDRVTNWITINEAWTVAVNGYSTGVHAPGRTRHPETEPYRVAHHLLLAHAHAVKIFKTEFDHRNNNYDKSERGGKIGMANCGDFRYPRDPNRWNDQMAAERAMLFQFGWFVDPIYFCDYPAAMRERLGDRLPHFSAAERELLQGSVDFLGLNYYSSFLASKPAHEADWGGYWADIFVNFSDDPAWDHNDMGWNIVPQGLYEMLRWVSKRYSRPIIYITENGSAESEPDLEAAKADAKRVEFFHDHLAASGTAIQQGVDLRGFFAWSLMDNFEWQFGYQRRFGICRVDFETLERTPKNSAAFYSETIQLHGSNLARWNSSTIAAAITPQTATVRPVTGQLQDDHHRLLMATSDSLANRLRHRYLLASTDSAGIRSLRELPEIVLIGYGSSCENVRRGVQSGVNVVIWSFLDIVASDDHHALKSEAISRSRRDGEENEIASGKVQTNLDLKAIRKLIEDLDNSGYGHVVHLVSFGGWNGPHLDARLSAVEWYSTFRREVGDIFHGIDWDLEGNDNLDNPRNFFTLDCLEKIGAISQMAKAGTCAFKIRISSSYVMSNALLQHP